jgi:hypothetical protein
MGRQHETKREQKKKQQKSLKERRADKHRKHEDPVQTGIHIED